MQVPVPCGTKWTCLHHLIHCTYSAVETCLFIVLIITGLIILHRRVCLSLLAAEYATLITSLLYLHPVGGGTMFSGCPAIRECVRPSVHLYVSWMNVDIYWSYVNETCHELSSCECNEMKRFSRLEVKGQGRWESNCGNFVSAISA